MSNTVAMGAVAPLSLDDYGDPATYAEERRRLFHPALGPLYLGHDSLLPGPGPGHVRAVGDERVLLTRSAGGSLRALANVCSHALRPLVEHDERSGRDCITCPYHQWSFTLEGLPAGSRAVAATGDTAAALALAPYPVTSWQGLHFAGDTAAGAAFRADLALLETAAAERRVGTLDVSGWVLVGVDEDHYVGDWKTFLEVYGDCYHVPSYHRGLASFADCATLEWSLGDGVHAQFVQSSRSAGRRSPDYAHWRQGVERYYSQRGEPLPGAAVAWLAVYPNLMLECYLGLRVLSVVVPTGPATYMNRVHQFVPPDMEQLVPGLPATIRRAYAETAVEDRVLTESRHRGILHAQELGLGEGGAAYRSNLSGPAPEAGTAHFHQWWRDRMRPPTEAAD